MVKGYSRRVKDVGGGRGGDLFYLGREGHDCKVESRLRKWMLLYYYLLLKEFFATWYIQTASDKFIADHTVFTQHLCAHSMFLYDTTFAYSLTAISVCATSIRVVGRFCIETFGTDFVLWKCVNFKTGYQ